jgi:dTDP-4-dehydrorhamnose reductase
MACRGLFHAAGDGETTWAEFAEAIFEGSRTRGGPSARVRAITTAEFPTLARRPANSRLNCDRLAAATGYRPPPWRDSLTACLAELPPR